MSKLHDLVDLNIFCDQKVEQLGLTENKVHKTQITAIGTCS